MDKKTEPQVPKKLSVSINLDTTPILYASNISVSTNPEGVVIDVMQRLGTGEQVRIVGRIGMSREHAKRFVQEMGRVLALTEGSGKTGREN